MPRNHRPTEPSPRDHKPRNRPLILPVVVYESSILVFGLLTGFSWTLYNCGDPDKTEIINIIIGLSIFIMILSRYIYRVKVLAKLSDLNTVTREFAIELSVYTLGMIAGLFWYIGYKEHRNVEVHIIMALLVTVYGMIRSVKILTSRQG